MIVSSATGSDFNGRETIGTGIDGEISLSSSCLLFSPILGPW